MTRSRLLFIAFVAVLIGTSATVGLHDEAKFTAQRQSLPIRRERPTAGVQTAVPFTDLDAVAAEEQLVNDYLEGVERDRIAAEEAERARLAQEAADAARAAALRQPVPRTATAPVATPSGCDGHAWAIPVWIVWRESHCDYGARNPSSGACGAYQVIPSTWAGYAGYPSACDAPPAVQDEFAARLWAGGAGCSHWSAC